MKTDSQMFMDGLYVNKQNKKMDDYVMKTKFNTRNYKGMTVYYTHRKTDNVTLFISGGAVLKLTQYLQKLIDDLQIKNNILVFATLGTSSVAQRSAQSASSLSLITAHKVGVLNVQRCNSSRI